MRRSFWLLLVCALPVTAADLRFFDDAALHAVQFVDANEGWAVGDEGAIWHSIDGGATWERQATGVRASLRAVHFLNPYTGWAAGREELPHGGGSAGVLLFTKDGGLRWQRAAANALPGLNAIRFLDGTTGLVAGDGSDGFSTGAFVTRDSGRSWQPLPGPRAPTWLAADWGPGERGALAGAWNRLALVRGAALAPADVDTLGGRNLRSLRLLGEGAVAVGDGALVLFSDGAAGKEWRYADLKLPTEVRAAWDFRAAALHGTNVWVAGRPGSAVLHSPDRGETWRILPTGQSLPLNGIFFLDHQRGWAVGELGTVMATTDGGRTWQVRHRGGARAALLCFHARAEAVPVDTLALLGADEGYLVATVRLTASDAASAPLHRASEGLRLAAGVRKAGGAAGEQLWQFPVPRHLGDADKTELLKAWDRRHADRAAEEVLRQAVLALRLWQPDVVVTDHPESAAAGSGCDALVGDAVREAFQRAADPAAFPEQLTVLGLKPWRASKLYTTWKDRANAHVSLDLGEANPRFEASPRDFAAPAAALLSDAPAPLPMSRHFRLLASRLEGAEGHTHLMQGIALAGGGLARRTLALADAPTPEAVQAIRLRRNLRSIAEVPVAGLSEPTKLLAQIGPMLAGMPDDKAAPAAFGVASHFAREGQWDLAREAFLLMADRYPAHPLTADAYRWLIRHNTSGEARRRHELKQFIAVGQYEFRRAEGAAPDGKLPPLEKPKADKEEDQKPGLRRANVTVRDGEALVQQTRALQYLGSFGEIRRWHEGSLKMEPLLGAFGAVYTADPATQFNLQAARRALGDWDGAKRWYAQYVSRHQTGPWRDAAAAELWLVHRGEAPPKPALVSRPAAVRPFLDGKLNDACWSKAAVLGNAVGETTKDYPTEVWVTHDREFFYLALRCRHPAGQEVAAVTPRPRDADVRPFDRVNLLVDVDRDYSSFFHLQIDQRGCLAEDCRLEASWGDTRWNPTWYVARHSEAGSWTIEAAIPLVELTGEPITPGRAWAFNVVRVLPRRGVQAWSAPADAEPRPEGMGLLMFAAEEKRGADK